MNAAELNALWAEAFDNVDLLDVWSSGSTLTETLFPDPKETAMYQHTFNFTVTSRQADVENLIDGLRFEVSYHGSTLDEGKINVETKALLNPSAQITYDRLRAYHAQMRSVGITRTEGRHALIKLALGRDVTPASHLTNAELDKVLAAING